MHVGQLDVELKFQLHGADAEPRDHLEVAVVDRLHRLDAGGHRGDELVVQQALPHDVWWSRDLGRPGEVEPHYFARASASVRARRAATIARCVRYSAPAWMSSFASTPATDRDATSPIRSGLPCVPTSFAAAGARNGVSTSPVNARSARVIIPLATAINAAAPASAYPDAACSKLAYAVPAPLGGAGSWISVSNSLGLSAVVNGPLKNFRAATVRLPPFDCSVNVASSTSITGGMSAAGSAWANPPPIVPAFRTWRSPMCSVTSAISGYIALRSLDSSSSRYVVAAPIFMPAPAFFMPFNCASRPMSISVSGVARRNLSNGSRLCPPAITLAFLPSALSASFRFLARTYSKEVGITACLLSLAGSRPIRGPA